MQHVGNDIVDLTNPKTKKKSQDIRFINRVFTQGEKKQILNSADADVMLWILWASKEASYKVVSKSQPGVSSSPRAYEVSLQENITNTSVSGVVETPNGSIPVRIFKTKDSIHCIATTGTTESIDSIIWGVQRIAGDQRSPQHSESFAVREAAKNHLSLYFNLNPDEIEIRRPGGTRGLGAPIVYLNDRRAGVDISLSHEGEFVAYAFATGLPVLSPEFLFHIPPVCFNFESLALII